MDTLSGILLVVLLFSATIFFHELGHFLVAKWLGLKIKTFSIGFGRAIVRTMHQGVEYKIGWLPFGGYVALPQMDMFASVDGKADPDDPREYPPITPGKKILVSLAGPLCNILFALVLAFVLYRIGIPSSPEQLETTLGFVDPESKAYTESGFRIGDTIESIENTASRVVERRNTYHDYMVVAAVMKQVKVTVKDRDTGELKSAVLETTPTGSMEIPRLTQLGGRTICRVGQVQEGYAADLAGVLPKDVVTHFGDIEIGSMRHLQWLVSQFPGQEVPMTVLRDGQKIDLTVVPTPFYEDPETGETRYWMGIVFSQQWDLKEKRYPKPHMLLAEFSSLIFRILKALVTPSEAAQASKGFSGPAGIIMVLWMVRDSFAMALWFTVLLNVNLAILNLLPLPILDGGHITFSLYEMITRRPAGPRFLAVSHNIFFVLIIALFFWVTVRDFKGMVLPSMKKQEPLPEPEKPTAPHTGSPFVPLPPDRPALPANSDGA